jgi:hypothetical protein
LALSGWGEAVSLVSLSVAVRFGDAAASKQQITIFFDYDHDV